jgi:putative FmdB family regulatory protein
MPLYEYECESCGHRFERIQKFSDPLVDVCPVCGGPVRKLPSSPAIQFKGSGWYVTDYARKDQTRPTDTPPATGSDAAASGDSAGAAKTGSKADAASSASKSESTTGGSKEGSSSGGSKEGPSSGGTKSSG